MRTYFFLLVFIFAVHYTMGQQSSDMGIMGGATTFWGDIQKQSFSKSITPVVGILGRWNFNKRLSFRGQLQTGNLKAEGIFNNALIGNTGSRFSNFPADPTYTFNFNRSFQTIEGMMEFNFRKYKMGDIKRDRFTPFVIIGLGALYSSAPRTGSFILDPTANIPANPLATPPVLAQYPPYEVNGKRTNGLDVLTLTIPVGAGFKFNLSKRLGGMVELIARKTFSDNIDNLNDPMRFQNPNLTGNPPLLSYAVAKTGVNNTDWYATFSFSLIYQIWKSNKNRGRYYKV